jgi:tetratricopeptide (TPR) repeat protein
MLRFVLTIGAALAATSPLAAQNAAKPAVAPMQPAPEANSSLDSLYDRLSKAKSDEEARGIAGAIERAQLHSGSDTADLLMSRALTAIQSGDKKLAITLLSSVVKLAPDFTEAWNKRATVFYMSNDYRRSMADIAETLRRDPRHFGAWAGLGMILRETGDNKRAYGAFKRALAINPHLPTVQKAVDEMREEIEGRDI